MLEVYDLKLDRDWLRKQRSYYLYRGDGDVSDVYILEDVVGDSPAGSIRITFAPAYDREPMGRLYGLELRKDMLQKVSGRYIYWSQEKIGSRQIIGGVYILRDVFGENPPENLNLLLELG